jgi:SAM-dependent methyltransferase
MFRRLLTRAKPATPPSAGSAGAAADATPSGSTGDPMPSTDEGIRQAFWLVLARSPSADELTDLKSHADRGGHAAVLHRLLSSPEFHLIFSGWRDDIGIGKDPAAHEAGLRSVGSDAEFVALAYTHLLGRDADPAGLAHYVAELGAGEYRRQLVRRLVVSDEFEGRYTPIAARDGGGVVPRDEQLCELANPAKWDNPDWLRIMKSLQSVPHHKLAMHRKSYEWTQLLFGLGRLGMLDERTSVLSVGAGHECVLYWLANRVGRVVATDLYEGRWQTSAGREGDDRVVEDPAAFAPFPYRADRLTFHRMDGRALAFDDGAFDVVYSLSSIEHFGGFAGARAAMIEMTRVLAPNGVLAVATEYILTGPAYEEAFSAAEIQALFDVSGLQLVQPIDEQVYQRYTCEPVDLRVDVDRRPHMVVRVDDTVFTSVMAFLRKGRA